MDATLQWECQDHILLYSSSGNLDHLFCSHLKPLAVQRQVSIVRWFSEFCLGIARSLNEVHERILDRPGQSSDISAKCGKLYVGYGGLSQKTILFSSTGKSNEALFSTLYSVSKFGLSTFDSAMSVARGRREYLKPRASTERAPEYDICREVSLKSDVWSLGCILLMCVSWFVLGFPSVDGAAQRRKHAAEPFIKGGETKSFKGVRADDAFFIIVQNIRRGQPGARLSPAVVEVSVSRESSQPLSFSVTKLTRILKGCSNDTQRLRPIRIHNGLIGTCSDSIPPRHP